MFNNKNSFDKNEIEDILKTSKNHNKKFLNEILSIKKISSFDASYIMNKLDLTNEKIKLINMALLKYEKNKEINNQESHGDFLYRVITNIEKLESNHSRLFLETSTQKTKSENFNKLIDFIVYKSSFTDSIKMEEIKFSTIYN